MFSIVLMIMQSSVSVPFSVMALNIEYPFMDRANKPQRFLLWKIFLISAPQMICNSPELEFYELCLSLFYWIVFVCCISFTFISKVNFKGIFAIRNKSSHCLCLGLGFNTVFSINIQTVRSFKKKRHIWLKSRERSYMFNCCPLLRWTILIMLKYFSNFLNIISIRRNNMTTPYNAKPFCLILVQNTIMRNSFREQT